MVGAGGSAPRSPPRLRVRGLEVTVLDPNKVPLERVLGTDVGRSIATSTPTTEFWAHGDRRGGVRGDGAVERVRTSDGRLLECDFVVVGVGVSRAGLAAQAGLAVDDGILVDEHLRTGAGGVRRRRRRQCISPVLRRADPRRALGNALNLGPGRRSHMLSRAEPYDRLPYFFSDQYDVGMEYSGFARTDRSSSVATPRATNSSPSGSREIKSWRV